jgi:hypothetical protein
MSFAPIQPAWGRFNAPGQPPTPVVVTQLELSGWTLDAQSRPVALNRVHLDPSQTWLQGRCNCPLNWQVGGLPNPDVFVGQQ